MTFVIFLFLAMGTLVFAVISSELRYLGGVGSTQHDRRGAEASDDLHEPTQTLADLHEPAQTVADPHEPPQTVADLHQRPKLANPPPRIIPQLPGLKKDESHVRKSNMREAMANNSLPADAGGDPWLWANAGGAFGLSGDWRKALSTVESGKGLRGEHCSTSEEQEKVERILQRRRKTPPTEKVAACVRSKDFGRYLPEWIAFHYAIGVDEIMIYDDDSVDGTKDIVQPFVDAGIVQYRFDKVESRVTQMRPLKNCLARLHRRRGYDEKAPKWIMFHDTDEYIFPMTMSNTISDSFRSYDSTCCLQVRRVQYGSSGHRETPQGLTIETFLSHARLSDGHSNRLPKVVVNLAPANPELGVISLNLPSMHSAKGCKCDKVSAKDILINHYLGSIGDFVDKTRRYWQDNHSLDRVEKFMANRDVNDVATDTITHWACATREVLARVMDGVGLDPGSSAAFTDEVGR